MVYAVVDCLPTMEVIGVFVVEEKAHKLVEALRVELTDGAFAVLAVPAQARKDEWVARRYRDILTDACRDA